MAEKVCRVCGVSKPLNLFHRHPARKDGLSNECKECACAKTRAHYRATIEKRREYERVRSQDPKRRSDNKRRGASFNKTDKGRASRARCEARARKNRPERLFAKNAVNNAIASGRLVRQPCERCGAEPTHGHHEDYSKPLDVVWLCQPCHVQRHRELGSWRKSKSAVTSSSAG